MNILISSKSALASESPYDVNFQLLRPKKLADLKIEDGGDELVVEELNAPLMKIEEDGFEYVNAKWYH